MTVTDEVLESFAHAKDERFREVMRSLVKHLHAFASEVRITEAEWLAGIEFLTRTGHITDDKRQEFILLSDVLGLSMLTVGLNEPSQPGVTESTVFGPFFVDGAPEIQQGGTIAEGVKGTPCEVSGTVRNVRGEPIAGARLDVWEADEDGYYDVQYSGDRMAGRAWLRSDADGRYHFWSVVPASYPIPHDGPVGELMERAGRSPMRPAHVHFKVTAPGYRTLITHVFLAGDAHLKDDAVFGVKDSLIAQVEDRDGTPHLTFDIVLGDDQ
ncbi:hydroxyquinol 1,2-dioxygenase [Pseudonocardiaceae bacterium YIM PH 21723]|nr:hydroxyquinol 1,2-dioxygenase [Pseudonocardiaceae bacterium YIM PH 21723]